MATVYYGTYRGAGQFMGLTPNSSPVTIGASSTAGTDVEVRIAGTDGSGNVLTKEDVVLALDRIRNYMLDPALGSTTPPL